MRTKEGRTIVDTGNCTEDGEFEAFDRRGNRGHFEWFWDRLRIRTENGRFYSYPWKELELESFFRKPELYSDENKYMKQARRVERLAGRKWRPLDYQRFVELLAPEEKAFFSPVSLPENLAHPHRDEQRQRRAMIQMRRTAAAAA
jgi:hypothetical protein